MKYLIMTALLAVAGLGFPPASADGAENGWVRHMTESADGTAIAYYVKGTGGAAPLLVISGGPGSDHRYMRVGGSFDRLAAARQVVMFDQRGTSKSGAVTGEPRLAQWAADVEAIRLALGASRLDLLGHSFGGIVSMAYAETYSSHVKSITFANSTAPSIKETKSILAGVFPDRIEQWQQTRRALKPRFKASEISVFTAMEFVDLARGNVFMKAIENYDYNIEVNNALRVDMADLDYTESVSAYNFPVLVIHGRYDPVISPATAWNLYKLIPGAEVEILAAAGHLPFAERPDAFVERVTRFLTSQK